MNQSNQILSLNRGETAEVSENAYNKLVKDFGGVIAHRKEAGKFYVMVWLQKYRSEVLKVIENNP